MATPLAAAVKEVTLNVATTFGLVESLVSTFAPEDAVIVELPLTVKLSNCAEQLVGAVMLTETLAQSLTPFSESYRQ